MVDANPIHDDADHKAAVAEIERLWGAAPGSSESDKLDILVTLVDAFEEKRWPI
jgi:HTH-type transcriptional regulator/antitoxin HigA